MLVASRYKYEIVVDELKKLIGDGIYRDRLPSVRTMAGEFGVDTRTILKAVELLEQERLVHTDGTRGIKIRHTNSRKPKSGIINIVHPMIIANGGSENDLLIHSLLRQLEATNYRAIISMQCEKTMNDPVYWAGNNFDGYIFIYGREKENLPAHRILSKLQLPAVYTSQIFSDQVICDWVDFDTLTAMKKLLDELLRAGHRRIAYLDDYKSAYSFRQRVELFQNFMAEHELNFPEYLCNGELDGNIYRDDILAMRRDFVAKSARNLLKARRPPTAVFLFDLNPEPLVEIFEQAGLQLNSDYIVVQKKTVASTANLNAKYPTIYANYDRIAERAVRQLSALIDHPQTGHCNELIPLDFDFKELKSI